jgi:acyl transferase domain-containing protein
MDSFLETQHLRRPIPKVSNPFNLAHRCHSQVLVDFDRLKVRASQHGVDWPKIPLRRASVNSFGYGGTNSHVILDGVSPISLGSSYPSHISSYLSPDEDIFSEEPVDTEGPPYTVVLSANDEQSLRANIEALSAYLSNPGVRVKTKDLAYTLSQRRSHHFHRAYAVMRSSDVSVDQFTLGKMSNTTPRVGYVFSGQGAQWPQMGRALVQNFPEAKALLQKLDAVLQQLPTPPSWSLLGEDYPSSIMTWLNSHR